MTLEHLDDPMPPDLDGPRWEQIARRARARRARARALVASASVAAIVVAGTAVAFAARGTDHHGSLVVGATTTAPTSTATSQPSAVSTSTAAPAVTAPRDPNVWVTVELHVDHTTVAQGDDVTGTIVFRNWTNHTVTVPDDHGCLEKWVVAVGTSRAAPLVGWTDECASPRGVEQAGRGGLAQQYEVFRTGETRLAFSARTTELVCAGQSLIPMPKCTADGPPPFPPGPAEVWFVPEVATPHVQSPAPVPITITPKETPRAKRDFVMPWVTGQAIGPAVAALLRLSAGPICWRATPSGDANGVVIGQQPAPGSLVRPSDPINLTVAASARTPDVRGGCVET